jgi:hypothetical protein
MSATRYAVMMLVRCELPVNALQHRSRALRRFPPSSASLGDKRRRAWLIGAGASPVKKLRPERAFRDLILVLKKFPEQRRKGH